MKNQSTLFKKGQTITDKNGVDWTVWRVVDGIPFTVTSRRSYGSRENRTNYTWLKYYDKNKDEWISTIDPFPKFNPSNKDLKKNIPYIFETNKEQTA